MEVGTRIPQEEDWISDRGFGFVLLAAAIFWIAVFCALASWWLG